MFKRLVQLFFLFVLAAAATVAWFAWYASTPLLVPVGESASASSADSLVLEPVEAVSTDGTAIAGYLVRSRLSGAFSPRQNRVRDALKLRARLPHLEEKSELVVICTSWDQGIESSMPLAEGLAGAGYTCLVWDPRGKDNARKYCTYGLKEYADVTALLDAVSGKEGGLPPVAAVGQGFGAAVLLKAASEDPRIRCMVCMDCFPSLKTVAVREMEQDWGKPLCYPAFWLLDAGVDWRAGFSTFDVAPVDDALKLDFPVMVVCTNQYFFSTLEDCLGIYDSLKNEKKQLHESIREGEPYGTRERTFLHTVEGRKGEKFEKAYQVSVYAGDDELQAGIAEWIHDNTRMPMPRVLSHDSYSAPVTGTAPSGS